MKETDDFAADMRFGDWLVKTREAAKLSLRDAANAAGMREERLKGLELGYSEKGITRAEAASISKAYSLAVDIVLKRALEGS